MKRNYPDIHLIYSKTLLWLCCLFSLLSGCSSSTDEEAAIPPPAPSKVNLYKVAVIMPLSDTSAKEKCERTVAWAQETWRTISSRVADNCLPRNMDRIAGGASLAPRRWLLPALMIEARSKF